MDIDETIHVNLVKCMWSMHILQNGPPQNKPVLSVFSRSPREPVSQCHPTNTQSTLTIKGAKRKVPWIHLVGLGIFVLKS